MNLMKLEFGGGMFTTCIWWLVAVDTLVPLQCIYMYVIRILRNQLSVELCFWKKRNSCGNSMGIFYPHDLFLYSVETVGHTVFGSERLTYSARQPHYVVVFSLSSVILHPAT